MAQQNLGDLEQPHELAFQQKEWRIGRVVWALIFTTVLATALGLFGSGPLSDVTRATPDGALRVESQRFGRYGAALRLVIDVVPDDAGEVTLQMSRAYLTSMRIEQILPHPESTSQSGDSVSFRFAGNAQSGPTRVIFDLQPAARWRIDGWIAAGDDRVDVSHFIYP